MVNRKKALNRLYTGVCDIYEYVSIKDGDTKVIKTELNLIYAQIPCRASYYNNSVSIKTTKSDGFSSYKKQDIKLFLSKDISIKAGSVFIVTQNNKTTKYKNAGEPAIYTRHQEVMLKIYDEIS